MVQGLGPNIAENSGDVPAYACAPIAKQVPIGAYIGLPLLYDDGSLYGTLCAIHPEPLPDSVSGEFDFIRTQARLLSTLLSAERKTNIISDELKKEKYKSQLDVLTGVYNRRGWNRFLKIEDERCLRYNSTASIVILDLDGLKEVNDTQGHQAGDDLLKKTAACLGKAVRSCDVICRIGGDEFAVLVVESSEEETRQLVNRIREKLNASNISAAIGWSTSAPEVTLKDVMKVADLRMYEEKRWKTQN
ncbi:MAG: GGDEF domain-containing protein, partial [Gammaproteobacteria bacterium]|nr:GGDEF domain-containing protein [Gammaproteobacteria bacterium]